MTFWGLLGIVFITLKLIGVITWSWLWVTAPLWGPAAVFFAMWAVGLIMAVMGIVISGILACVASRKR